MRSTTRETAFNPIRRLGELLRILRQGFVQQIGMLDGTPPSVAVAEVLGGIAGLINDCEETAKLIDALERSDPEAWNALVLPQHWKRR